MKRLLLTTLLTVIGCGQDLIDETPLDLTMSDSASSDGDDGPPPVLPDLLPPCHAARFDGLNAILTAPAQSYLTPTGSFTIEAWVYPTTSTGERVIAGHWGDPASGTASYVLLLDTGGHVSLKVSKTGTDTVAATTTQTVAVNQWNHVAGVFDSAAATLYAFVGGASPGTSTLSSGPHPPVPDLPLHLGRYSAATPTESPFTGFLSDVSLSSSARYTAAFTPPSSIKADASTLALYHLDESSGQNAADSSIYGNVGSLLQNAIFAVAPGCH
jgi:hypothetical protein